MCDNALRKKYCLYFALVCGLLNILLMQAYIDPKDEKVIICGVGKNIAPFIQNMIQKIEALGNAFKDYHVIIYENNSSDQSSNLLRKWERINPKVTIISENVTADDLYLRTIAHAKRDKAPCRMELIAYGRNEVLKRAMSEDFVNYNFLIMTDLDFSRGWDVQGVLSSFNISTDWDCVTANGVNGNLSYYDRYAYRDEQVPLGPELIGEDFWNNFGRYNVQFSPGSELKRVISAFGGIAIYKKEALKNCYYSGYVTHDFERLMSDIINNRIDKNNWQYKLYKTTVDTNNIYNEIDLPVIFQSNCGYDGAVVCEHSTLHASMTLNGFSKIYVNPLMLCYY